MLSKLVYYTMYSSAKQLFSFYSNATSLQKILRNTNTLHIANYTLRIMHCTLQISHYTLRITYYTLQITHYTLNITHYTLHIATETLILPLLRLWELSESRKPSIKSTWEFSMSQPHFSFLNTIKIFRKLTIKFLSLWWWRLFYDYYNNCFYQKKSGGAQWLLVLTF